MTATKNLVLGLLAVGLTAFLCHAAYVWLLGMAAEPPPETPQPVASSPQPVDGGFAPLPVPTTAAAYRRLARSELNKARREFEACLQSHATDFDIPPSDPFVIDLSFQASPTGSGRALVVLKRLHSIPKALDTWLKAGRESGQPQPDWTPRPDLIPPDCLGPLLYRMQLPAPPTDSVVLSWALPSLQALGAAPAAAPSP